MEKRDQSKSSARPKRPLIPGAYWDAFCGRYVEPGDKYWTIEGYRHASGGLALDARPPRRG